MLNNTQHLTSAKKNRKTKVRELKTLDKNDVVQYTNKNEIRDFSPHHAKQRKAKNAGNSKRYDKPTSIGSRHMDQGEVLPDITQSNAY